jgi:hypothetical protein
MAGGIEPSAATRPPRSLMSVRNRSRSRTTCNSYPSQPSKQQTAATSSNNVRSEYANQRRRGFDTVIRNMTWLPRGSQTERIRR